jgi:penicillin G amidase
VVAGHNGYVAWGFTNGFSDVQDIYIEHLKKLPNGEIQSEYNGNWEKIQIINEQIKIKKQKPVTEEVLITRHGPIINVLSPDFCGEEPLALRWTALEPDKMIQMTFLTARAKNCYQLHKALNLWTTPVQNVVYADTEGNIGYTFAGKIPIRAKNKGRLPVPGWTDEYEWTGYTPFDALPHIINPDQGFIVTANHRVVSEDYPAELYLEPVSGDRAQRISEMILDNSLRDGHEKIDIPFIQRMQFDTISPSARIFSRRLSQLTVPDSAHYPETDLHAVLKLFQNWDGDLTVDSCAAAIYQVFIRQFCRLVLSDKLQPEKKPQADSKPIQAYSPSSPICSSGLVDRVMGKGPTQILAESSLFGSHWLPWLINLLDDPDSKWFDLGKGEKRDDVMQLALRKSVDELVFTLGSTIQEWSWGRLHQTTFQHVLGSSRWLSSLLNLGPYPVGGDHTTICASSTFTHNLDTDQMVGPPFRMIIDLKNLENSVCILAPGQAGNPASYHYNDQVIPWLKGGYHPMLYHQSEIEQQGKHCLKLFPR